MDWVNNSVQKESGYYWTLAKRFENFDFVKDIDRFMETHGPFDPEKDRLPTKADIQKFVKST